MHSLTPEPVNILGVPIHPVTLHQLHAHIHRSAQCRQQSIILYANAHGVNLAQSDPALRDCYRAASLVICDGFGPMLAASLRGQRIPERITYADWIWQLAAFMAQEGLTLYLLGAQPAVAERAACRLQAHAPTLRIVGTQHGYFDRQTGNGAIVDAINAAAPDVLLVGFGMPLQERWIAEHTAQLDVPVILAGGAALDYAAGVTPRGPRWLTDHGFEWLARLWFEPRRLWKRYIVGNPAFLWRVLTAR